MARKPAIAENVVVHYQGTVTAGIVIEVTDEGRYHSIDCVALGRGTSSVLLRILPRENSMPGDCSYTFPLVEPSAVALTDEQRASLRSEMIGICADALKSLARESPDPLCADEQDRVIPFGPDDNVHMRELAMCTPSDADGKSGPNVADEISNTATTIYTTPIPFRWVVQVFVDQVFVDNEWTTIAAFRYWFDAQIYYDSFPRGRNQQNLVRVIELNPGYVQVLPINA